MPLTISTPYKTSTISSVSGTTFVSAGTPFVAGDVGRFIRLTTGSGLGQIRKITAYVSSTTVTLSHAWNVSVLSSRVEVTPSAGDEWVMSHKFSDIHNTTDVLRVTSTFYRILATLTLSGTVFLADERIALEGNGNNLRFDVNTCFQLGSLNANGFAEEGCIFSDLSTSSSGVFSAAGLAGDAHFYACQFIYYSATVSANSAFWRLYRGTSQIVTIVNCRFNGTVGLRVQGTKSVIRGIEFLNNQGSVGPIGPIGTLGELSGVTVRNALTFCRFLQSLGVGTVVSPRVQSLSIAGVQYETNASAVDPVRIEDYIETDMTNAVNFTTGSGTGYVEWYQYIDTSAVTTSLTPITSTLRRVLRRNDNTVVSNTTTTSGSFTRYQALTNTHQNTVSGVHLWSNGTVRTPFTQAVVGYAYNAQTLTMPLVTSNTTQFTMLADTDVTLSETAARALTSVSSLCDSYDVLKVWSVDNAATAYPSFGALVAIGTGDTLDLTSKNIVYSASAPQLVDINTSNSTITLKSNVSMLCTRRTVLKTTGWVTMEVAPSGIIFDSCLYIVVTSVPTGVTIRNSTQGYRITTPGTYNVSGITFTNNTSDITVTDGVGSVNIITGGRSLTINSGTGNTVTTDTSITCTISGWPTGTTADDGLPLNSIGVLMPCDASWVIPDRALGINLTANTTTGIATASLQPTQRYILVADAHGYYRSDEIRIDLGQTSANVSLKRINKPNGDWQLDGTHVAIERDCMEVDPSDYPTAIWLLFDSSVATSVSYASAVSKAEQQLTSHAAIRANWSKPIYDYANQTMHWEVDTKLRLVDKITNTQTVTIGWVNLETGFAGGYRLRARPWRTVYGLDMPEYINVTPTDALSGVANATKTVLQSDIDFIKNSSFSTESLVNAVYNPHA